MSKNWPVKKLGEVAEVTDFVANGSFATLRKNVKYMDREDYAILVRTTDLINNFTGKLVYIDKNAYYFLKKSKLFGREIILSNVGTIGAVFRTPSFKKPMSLAPNAVMIKPSSYNDFLFFYLKSNMGQLQLKNITSQTSQPKFNKTDLRNLPLPIPPENIQKKIVERLDAIRKAQELNDQQISKTEELFESILDIEFSKGSKWNFKKLEEISSVTSSKRIFQKDYVREGIPFYRTKEIAELSKDKPISLELYISERQYKDIAEKFGIPKKGDIVISAVGTIGISWIVPDNRKFYFKDGNLLWIKNFKEIDPKYLKFFLNYSFSSVSKLAAGGAYKALTIINLKKFQVPISPILKQKRIIEKLSAVQECKKLLLKQKSLLAELFDSVLDKCMKGEVVN